MGTVEDLAHASTIKDVKGSAFGQADSGERWTVLFGGGVRRVIKFGKQPYR
jgi:hypothetical protein